MSKETAWKEGELFIVPIGVGIGTVNYLHEDKYGNLYKFDATVDFKKGNIIKIDGKIVHYGPFLKRLSGNIFVISFSLGICLLLVFIFGIDIKIIYYISGIIAFMILSEIFIRIKNRNYEKSHSIEIVKNN